MSIITNLLYKYAEKLAEKEGITVEAAVKMVKEKQNDEFKRLVLESLHELDGKLKTKDGKDFNIEDLKL